MKHYTRILRCFGIPFRVIHDTDRKGLSEKELLTLHAIHPFHANEKIQEAAGGCEIHLIDDTFENVLWPTAEDVKSQDKPYRAWCRIKQITDGTVSADDLPQLKEVFTFAYNW